MRNCRASGHEATLIAMEPSAFDELAFFRAVSESGARALLIGRRALVLLGLPVLTADYDFWLAIDDIAAFNAACAPFGLSILTKQAASRPKDIEDIRLLRLLLDEGER